jgi:hypothetical protein
MKNRLANYLNELSDERFSGFNGQEYDLGVDGSASTSGCVRPNRPAKSFSITFYNSTGGAGATFVLFGANRYLAGGGTYGSSAGIVITCGGGVSYPELLSQIQQKPFYANRMKIVAGTTIDITQTLSLVYRNANGRELIDPITLGEFYDVYQQVDNMLDLTYDFKVDGTMYLTGTLSAAGSIQFIIYPERISDPADLLNGDTATQNFLAPVLSAAVPVRPSSPQIASHPLMMK